MTAADLSNIIVKHSDILKPYAVSLTRDQDDAKDLFQETILRALTHKDKYQFGTNLKAWLYTIMRNIFINNYRKNKRFIKVGDDISSDTLSIHTGRSTENNGMANIRMSEIKKAMDDLPEAFRLSFELHYIGYKYQEISTLLHEPLGTIKSRIHFARKMLVSKLDR